MYNTPLHYGSYVYPRWGKALGVCMATVSCLQILIWAVVAISKETGTLKEVCVSSPQHASVSVRLNLWRKLFLSCFFFFHCSVSKTQSDPWTPGGSTMPTTVRGWVHKWSRREWRFRSPSISQTWISMHRRGRWGAKREAEASSPTSEWQTKRFMRYSSQRGWWSDCVLQGSIDFWLYLYCVYFSCFYFFYMV